jgi:hypothetical protein
MEFTRRDLVKGSAALLALGASRGASAAGTDPLPSWNEGAAKFASARHFREKASQRGPETATRSSVDARRRLR